MAEPMSDGGSTPSRRAVVGLAGTGLAAAMAVSDPAAASAPKDDSAPKDAWRESDHVRAYYARARF